MKNTYKLKNKGFILTLLLVSLPVFLTALLIFTSLIFCIRNYDKAHSICLKHSLDIQKNLSTLLEKLLKLNPTADRLRALQKELERLYRQAISRGDMVSASALKAQISIVKFKRKILDQRQKSILIKSQRKLHQGISSFRKEIYPMKAQNIQTKYHTPYPLAVTAKPLADIAPSYYRKSHFSQQQALLFFWKMPLYVFLPQWIKNIFFVDFLSSYHCSATIKQQGAGWKAGLRFLRRRKNVL